MKCPSCQAENREGARYCGECGKSLQEELTCPQCGHKNPSDNRFCDNCGHSLTEPAPESSAAFHQPSPSLPTSFANGRYQVKKFLGEGGKKKVLLAHDAVLDRDIAMYLIKTEKLDEAGRTRIRREAQAMARLGDHPNIASVHDFGDHGGQPYMVAPLLSGGDVEDLIKKAPDHKLPLDKTLEIAKAVCKGLEFAHSKGIIHRDVKPGNVMLTADGTAKLNDFGLAVAVDLSRLTQAGMMVGTVSYMPPEQAMGGNVTARADLYSLGAMLYEMVTGRPPFVGDDSIAIIGQHINTPPVSPSWHRADLPPSLETLIMQLLEKDPEKRPASAKVVLEALESIGQNKAVNGQGDPSLTLRAGSPPPENPLYRRVFVGREQELKTLQSAFDGAMSGRGALMMVLGEPGIGKTALCEQLETYVTLRGGRTLVGHCYEEGSLSLPYLAFVEAMRSYVLDRGVDDLKKELGSGATDVARIVSEIREKLDVKPRVAENPEEDRYRLMQSVTSFLTHAAAVKPMLVVLEDLHDADKGTLEMLTYVSRNLSGARLLIVGTYRDVEVDRTHPLSAALAELRRVSTFGRVILRGLNADEVRRMLESITRESVPWSLAEAVHRQTEGNPLFVQEVVRYLAEQKLLVRAEGKIAASGSTPLDMNIPEGLRDVIGKRISSLSPGCNHLLSIAAVIGREFALDTLKAVAGMDEAAFVATLKEAVQLSVLEERPQVGQVRYRFTHAFFRQTLYEEMIAPERLKLHQQVGRALETLYQRRLGEHAAELAEHFSQSTDPADLKKAVEYGVMAAKRAVDVYAYGEAVRLLDAAVRVQRVLDPDDKEMMCELLLALCDALIYVPDTKRILMSEAPFALSLAESVGDDALATRACMTAITAILVEQAAPGLNSPQMADWAERADKYARTSTAERVLVDSIRGGIISVNESIQKGVALVTRAFELAHTIEDRNTLWFSGAHALAVCAAPQHARRNLEIAEEVLTMPRAGLKTMSSTLGYMYVGHTFLKMGNRQRSQEIFDEYRRLAVKTGNTMLGLTSEGLDVIFDFMDGDFDRVLDVERSIRSRGREAGVNIATEAVTSFADFMTRIYRGISLDRLEQAYRALPVAVGDQPYQTNRMFCILLAHLGKKDEVSRYLDRFVVKRINSDGMNDEWPDWNDAQYLEAAVMVGHSRAAEFLLNRLAGSGVVTTGTQQITCIPRTLGGAAALLGRYDEAREHYREAIRVCTEMRFRPELALTRLQFAELLLEHYPDEKEDALEHLDFAIKEFRDMKMQPSLERALRHKEILKA